MMASDVARGFARDFVAAAAAEAEKGERMVKWSLLGIDTMAVEQRIS